MLLRYQGPRAVPCLRALSSVACCLLFAACSSAPQRGNYTGTHAAPYAAVAVRGAAPATVGRVAPTQGQQARTQGQTTLAAQNPRSIPAPSVTLQARTSMRGPAMQEAMQAAGLKPAPAALPAPRAPTLQAASLQPASFKSMTAVPAVLHRPDPVSTSMPDALGDPLADMPLLAVRSAGGSCPLPVYRLAWSSAARSGLEPAMVAAVIEAESRCRADAVSDAGAWGLMQLMPQYGAREANRLVHGRDIAPNTDALRDPETNIRLGVAYLAALREHFAYIDSEGARMLLTIAAYNCGADFIERRLPGEARGWDAHRMSRWLQGNTPAETRSYVSTVLAKSERYAAAIVAAASRQSPRQLAASH